MASYVSPNYNPAYFDLPVFEAPVDMAFKVGQQKQAQFDAGLRQVQSQYQNTLNLPVQSQYNTARRDAFMKDAENKLRQISTADFSLQENVSAAGNIYKPLVQDQSILKEMSQISKGKKSYGEHMSRMNSKEEKVRGTANSYSEFLIGYEMNKISSAKSQDDLDKIDESNLTYVPATDYEKRFTDQMNIIIGKGEGGVSKDEIKNYYISTMKNGKQAVGAFTQMGLSMLTPEDVAYFQSAGKAELIRTEQGYITNGLTPTQARESIVKGVMETEFEKFNVQVNAVDAHIAKLTEELSKYEKASSIGNNEDEITQVQNRIATLKHNIEELGKQKTSLVSNRDDYDPTKTEFYTKKFDFLKARPEVGLGQNIAYRKASNIASAFAYSTAAETIKENTVQTKLDEYKVKIMQEQAKIAKESAEKNETSSGTEEGFSEITPLGKETKTIKTEKVYDYVQNRKSQFVQASNMFGLEMVKEVVGMSGNAGMIHGKYYDDISEKLSNNKGTDKVPQEIIQSFNKGFDASITGDLTYSQLNNKLVEVAKEKFNTSFKNPDLTKTTPESLRRAFTYKNAMEKNDISIARIKKEEDKISNELLQNEKYKDLRVQNEDGTFRILSEEEYHNKTGKRQFIINYYEPSLIEKMTPATSLPTIRDVKEMTISEAKKFSEQYGIPLNKMEIVNPDYNYIRNPLTGLYDIATGNMTFKGERIQSFEKYYNSETKKYEELVNPTKEKISSQLAPTVDGLAITTGQKEVGFQVGKFKLNFSDKSNDVLGEQVVNMMLDDQFIREVAATSGVDQDKFTEFINKLKSGTGGLKTTSGHVEVSAIGADGKSPQYKLMFSNKYLEEQFTADEIKDNPDIMKIINRGILINNPNISQRITNELAGKFSIIASSVDTEETGSKNFAEIDDKHYVNVRYAGNNSYQITPYYTEGGVAKNEPPQDVPREKLDAVMRYYETLLFSSYLTSKQKATTQTAYQILQNR